MSTSLEDFKSVSQLQDNLEAVLDQVRRTGRPVIVTKKGKPSVVILDVATYAKKLHALELGRLLAEAKAEIDAGKGRPVEEFFAELDREKAPRHHRARRRT